MIDRENVCAEKPLIVLRGVVALFEKVSGESCRKIAEDLEKLQGTAGSSAEKDSAAVEAGMVQNERLPGVLQGAPGQRAVLEMLAVENDSLVGESPAGDVLNTVSPVARGGNAATPISTPYLMPGHSGRRKMFLR